MTTQKTAKEKDWWDRRDNLPWGGTRGAVESLKERKFPSARCAFKQKALICCRTDQKPGSSGRWQSFWCLNNIILRDRWSGLFKENRPATSDGTALKPSSGYTVAVASVELKMVPGSKKEVSNVR
ncbi:MAG: hypothetical protein ACTHN5_07880 [Phycisphaerae bacterium]